MNDFNNRIDAQRNILRIVNQGHWYVEELSGLSNKAIDRWMIANQIDAASRLAELIRLAGRALFFLANKSQEQVTGEYEHHSRKVADLTSEIAKEIESSY
ncbi:hypothetical protein [Pseudomonas putida]|uniref:hypothetical protein n=1 Tax=Pseudomonas putida TaxID=303 RepID=UPI002B24F163|nr:hypothetical protein [Pseudomonas putida]